MARGAKAKTVFLFLIALLLGSLIAGFMFAAETSLRSDQPFSAIIVIGIGATFVQFGILPGLAVGVPAILVLRRWGFGRWSAALVLAMGGALTGALFMPVTFPGLESPGAVAGGSVGFMLRIILFPRQRTEALHG
jgi:hypothetical protein